MKQHVRSCAGGAPHLDDPRRAGLRGMESCHEDLLLELELDWLHNDENTSEE